MMPSKFLKTPKTFVAFLSLQLASTAYVARADDGSERFHQAIQSCVESLNLPAPQPGTKPPPLDQEQRSAMNDCLERQGASPPPEGPPQLNANLRKQMDACLAGQGVPPPQFSPGSRPPALSDAQKTALDQCREQVAESSDQP